MTEGKELRTQVETYRTQLEKLRSENLKLVANLTAVENSRTEIQKAFEAAISDSVSADARHTVELKCCEQRLEKEWIAKLTELKKKALVKLKEMKQTHEAELARISSTSATDLKQLLTSETQMHSTGEDRIRLKIDTLNSSLLNLCHPLDEMGVVGKMREKELEMPMQRLADRETTAVTLCECKEGTDLQLRKSKELLLRQKKQIRLKDRMITELEEQLSASKQELSHLKEAEMPVLQRKVDESEKRCVQLAEELSCRQVTVEQKAGTVKDEELQRLADEYRRLKKETDEEHRQQLKQVFKECQAHVTQKERNAQTAFVEAQDKYLLSAGEQETARKREVKELRRELREKEETIDNISQELLAMTELLGQNQLMIAELECRAQLYEQTLLEYKELSERQGRGSRVTMDSGVERVHSYPDDTIVLQRQSSELRNDSGSDVSDKTFGVHVQKPGAVCLTDANQQYLKAALFKYMQGFETASRLISRHVWPYIRVGPLSIQSFIMFSQSVSFIIPYNFFT